MVTMFITTLSRRSRLYTTTEPRKTPESSAFTHIDVKKYLDYVNDKTIVVHRINECDERKIPTRQTNILLRQIR